jgi:hypothetical protein
MLILYARERDSMKKYFMPLILLGLTGYFLTGCAATKYDANEYNRYVNIIEALSKPEVFCDTKKLSQNVSQLYDDTHIIYTFQSGEPNNEDMMIIIKGLLNDEQRFKDLVAAGPVSTEYCQLKLKSLLSTWQFAIVAEGSKPR